MAITFCKLVGQSKQVYALLKYSKKNMSGRLMKSALWNAFLMRRSLIRYENSSIPRAQSEFEKWIYIAKPSGSYFD